MFARHSNARVLAVELIQRFEVLKNDLCLACAQEWRGDILICQIRIDITKNPWCTLCGAPDHYSFCTGEIKYCKGLLRRVDITVGDHRYAQLTARAAHRLVFCAAAKKIGACAAMHAEGRDATVLRKSCNPCRIAPARVHAGAYLECDGHRNRTHYGSQDALDLRLTGQQRRTRVALAHFLCRTAHVDVYDLCTECDIDLCGAGDLHWIGAHELHHARLGFAVMIHASARLDRIPETLIGAEHLGAGQG